MLTDTYLTIGAPAESVYVEKRSRFLAFAHHVTDEEQVRTLVADYRKKYYDARHVCYAYALGPDASHTRANDDGEPSGAAGKPILGQLRSLELTDVLVIVVRYFGGVKLGTGGLARAYKTASADALALAPLKECVCCAEFIAEVPYTEIDIAERLARNAGASIIHREHTATATMLTISVRYTIEESLRQSLTRIHTIKILRNEP